MTKLKKKDVPKKATGEKGVGEILRGGGFGSRGGLRSGGAPVAGPGILGSRRSARKIEGPRGAPRDGTGGRGERESERKRNLGDGGPPLGSGAPRAPLGASPPPRGFPGIPQRETGGGARAEEGRGLPIGAGGGPPGSFGERAGRGFPPGAPINSPLGGFLGP
ncbi:unnamed protein product [Arctia plantaginis]|uniref:Uncharacterized protein n=1 Tax=Arctia plantaginis TaxID=874455 RepID=A0A8S1BKS3_ARCPL|nr:unnamed protein product [Arctia plantaginis]